MWENEGRRTFSGVDGGYAGGYGLDPGGYGAPSPPPPPPPYKTG